MIRSIVLIVALLGSGSAAADEATYLIQCDIVNGERLLGSPAVVAKSGSKVEVSVTDTYALSLIAEGQDNNRVKLSTDIALNGESHSRTLLLNLDRPAEIQLGDTTLTVTISSFVPDDA